MYQITIGGDSFDINFILFICDLLKDDDVQNGSENLSYLMDKLLGYFGEQPIEMAAYGLEDIRDFEDTIEKMRHFVETFYKAVEIPQEQVIAERQRRRGIHNG